MPQDVPIDELLAELGIASGENAAVARAQLETLGLTNARKTRISRAKVDQVRRALAEAFVLACDECAASVAPGPRARLAVTAAACALCGGSVAQRAALRLAAGTPRLRVVVLGGSPGTGAELVRRLGPVADLRYLPGTTARSREQAQADVAWADVVVVWASTELPHKLSQLYTRVPDPGGKVVTVARRGVAAAIDAIVEWKRRRASPAPR